VRLEDRTQNLPARIRTLQIIVFVLLGVCVVRLYKLQIVHGDFYHERAINQRLRVLSIPAPRGAILDRHGNILVDSRPVYDVVLQREKGKELDFTTLLMTLPGSLDLDPEYLKERFSDIKRNPAHESILIKENGTIGDIAWVEAHSLEFPLLHVEERPQRDYPANGLLAHVLGYVGEINLRQLELPQYQELKPGDVIGKEGLEATYDHFLRGRDGSRTVIVDSLGRIQDVVEIVEPIAGQDLVTTIDLDLQLAAEEQLRNSLVGQTFSLSEYSEDKWRSSLNQYFLFPIHPLQPLKLKRHTSVNRSSFA
jgi:penicillin-binding protein 2